MTLFATGNFVGSAGANITSITESDGGTWAKPYSVDTGSILLDGTGRVKTGSTSTSLCMKDSLPSSAADMNVNATVNGNSSGSGEFGSVVARLDPTQTNPTCYEWRYNNNGASAPTAVMYVLQTNVGGAGIHFKQLGTTQTLSTGLIGTDVGLKLDCTGTTITGSINGTALVTVTDSSIAGTGSQIYCGIKMAGGTGAHTFLSAYTANYTASVSAVATVRCEAKLTGTEICFTPIGGGTSYAVKSSTTSGGSYTTIATISSGSTPRFLDVGNYGLWYTVTVSGGSPSTPVQAPAAYVASASPTSTILQRPPAGRHNLLYNPSGGAEVATDILALTFSQKSTQANVCQGPFSDFAIVEETMLGSGLSSFAALGTLSGTLTFANDVATYAGIVTDYDYWRSPAQFQGPSFCVGLAAENVAGRIGVGVGIDSTHGLFAEYNGADQTIKVFGNNGGTITSFLAATASGMTNTSVSFALEVCHASYTVWVLIGDTWSVLSVNTTSAVANGYFDFRTSGKLTTFQPMFYMGSNTAEATPAATLREVRGTGFNGIGKVRECAVVTHLDGSPLWFNGVIIMGADRCGFPQNSTNAAYQTVYSLHGYDPLAGRIVGNHKGAITANFGGNLGSLSDAKIVYDDAAGGFHIWGNDWTLINVAPPWSTRLWYQFVPGNIIGQDTLLSSPSLVTAPGVNYPGTSFNILDGTHYTMYGVDVRKIGSFWYMTGTAVPNPLSASWLTVVLKGSSPNIYSSVISAGTTAYGEGQTFLDMGSMLYVLAGEIQLSGTSVINNGGIFAYDFSDLATLNYIGLVPGITQAAADAGSIEPQQPAYVAWNQGNRTKLQILGHDSQYVSNVYQVTGGFHSYEANLELEGWQFPQRSGVPGANTIIQKRVPRRGR